MHMAAVTYLPQLSRHSVMCSTASSLGILTPEKDGIPTPLQSILDVATEGRLVFVFGVFRVAFGSFEDDNDRTFIAFGTERTFARSSSDRVEDEVIGVVEVVRDLEAIRPQAGEGRPERVAGRVAATGSEKRYRKCHDRYASRTPRTHD